MVIVELKKGKEAGAREMLVVGMRAESYYCVDRDVVFG